MTDFKQLRDYIYIKTHTVISGFHLQLPVTDTEIAHIQKITTN